MKRIHILFAYLVVVIITGPVLADELHMKDGSIIRGKLLKEVPGQSYRIQLKDGSEVVYSVDKVESVQFTKSPVESNEQETKTPLMATGVVEPATGSYTASDGGWDNTGVSARTGTGNYVKDSSLGLGLGKYGTIGAELNIRSSDSFGLSLGIGAQYYLIQYTTTYSSGRHSYSESSEDSGFAAMGGIKTHFYFTPRSESSQHNIFLAAYYGEAMGPAFGIGYGYESHSESGGGWDFSIGLLAAPDAQQRMAEMVGVDENNIDYTFIPILVEVGFFF